MSLDEAMERLEPSISPVFRVPRSGVKFLGYQGSIPVGLELPPRDSIGQMLWNLDQGTKLGEFPNPIYPRVWKVDGRCMVMEYHWATGAIICDLQSAYVVFALDANGRTFVPGSETRGEPILVGETISTIHQRGSQYLVENSSIRWENNRVLYDLKTGKIVASRDNTSRAHILQGRIIGQDNEDKCYYDLETGVRVFEAPPGDGFACGGIVELGDLALVNSDHQAYDLRSRRVICPLPQEVPDNFDVQLIAGKSVVPGFDRKTYYDILTGKIAFTLPVPASLQTIEGRYFMTPSEQPANQTVISEVKFSPVTVH